MRILNVNNKTQNRSVNFGTYHDENYSKDPRAMMLLKQEFPEGEILEAITEKNGHKNFVQVVDKELNDLLIAKGGAVFFMPAEVKDTKKINFNPTSGLFQNFLKGMVKKSENIPESIRLAMGHLINLVK